MRCFRDLGRPQIFILVFLLFCFFLANAGSGWKGPFTRGADVAGWTASMAGNVRATLSCMTPPQTELGSSGGDLVFCMFGHPDARPLWHQSPLPYFLTGIAFKYFGSSEKVARLIPLIFTLLAGFLLYRTLAEVWDGPTGLLGLFAFWMSPRSSSSQCPTITSSFRLRRCFSPFMCGAKPSTIRLGDGWLQRSLLRFLRCGLIGMLTSYHSSSRLRRFAMGLCLRSSGARSSRPHSHS